MMGFNFLLPTSEKRKKKRERELVSLHPKIILWLVSCIYTIYGESIKYSLTSLENYSMKSRGQWPTKQYNGFLGRATTLLTFFCLLLLKNNVQHKSRHIGGNDDHCKQDMRRSAWIKRTVEKHYFRILYFTLGYLHFFYRITLFTTIV